MYSKNQAGIVDTEVWGYALKIWKWAFTHPKRSKNVCLWDRPYYPQCMSEPVAPAQPVLPCALHWEVRELRILASRGTHVDKADAEARHMCHGGQQSGRLLRHNYHLSISDSLLRYVSFHLLHLITGLRKRNLIFLTRTYTSFYKKPNKILCRYPAHYRDAEKSSGEIIIKQQFSIRCPVPTDVCIPVTWSQQEFQRAWWHNIQRYLPRKEPAQNFLAQLIPLQWLEANRTSQD